MTLASSSAASARRVVAAGSGVFPFPTAPGVPEDRRPSARCAAMRSSGTAPRTEAPNALGWPFCTGCRACSVPRGSLRVSRFCVPSARHSPGKSRSREHVRIRSFTAVTGQCVSEVSSPSLPCLRTSGTASRPGRLEDGVSSHGAMPPSTYHSTRPSQRVGPRRARRDDSLQLQPPVDL